MSIKNNKGNRDRRSARVSRCKERAAATAAKHYDFLPEDVDTICEHIRTSKSSFVVRWGQLRIHKVSLVNPTAVVYVAYDRLVAQASFFIPRKNGEALEREVAKHPKGRRAPKMLLPRLASTSPVVASAQQSLDLEEDTGNLALERNGLRNRIRFLKVEVQKCLSGDLSDAKNWEVMNRMSERLDVLEKQLAALEDKKAEAVATSDTSEDGAKRKELLTILEDIDWEIQKQQMQPGPTDRSLVHKRKDLFDALQLLIPGVHPKAKPGEAAFALLVAIRDTKEEVIAFEKSRCGQKLDHPTILKNRATSLNLRLHARVLKGMWFTMYDDDFDINSLAKAEAAAAVQEAEALQEAPPPTQPSQPPRTISVIGDEIIAINKTIDASTNVRDLMGMYAIRDELQFERIGLVPEIGGQPPSYVEIKAAKMKRIQATQANIQWFVQAHDLSIPAVCAIVDRKREVLRTIRAEYQASYPNSGLPSDKEKGENDQAQTQPLPGPR